MPNLTTFFGSVVYRPKGWGQPPVDCPTCMGQGWLFEYGPLGYMQVQCPCKQAADE